VDVGECGDWGRLSAFERYNVWHVCGSLRRVACF
jgi:hypothetical protein